MTAKRRVECMRQAPDQHGKPDIISSDQGSQFTSQEYMECQEGHDIQINMDGRGGAIDNIFIEMLLRSVSHQPVYL